LAVGSSDSSDNAVDAVYRTHRNAVLNYVRRHFGVGPPDPEDVVQTVFERYFAQAEGHIDNPRAFLLRSARNFVIDQRRRHSVQMDYAREVQSLSDGSDDVDAQRVLEGKQRLGLLERAIADLDPRTREMLLMSRIQGLSSAEIARRKHCSPTLVKKLIAKALVACHRALDEPE